LGFLIFLRAAGTGAENWKIPAKLTPVQTHNGILPWFSLVLSSLKVLLDRFVFIKVDS
jgi:hypothetical protein